MQEGDELQENSEIVKYQTLTEDSRKKLESFKANIEKLKNKKSNKSYLSKSPSPMFANPSSSNNNSRSIEPRAPQHDTPSNDKDKGVSFHGVDHSHWAHEPQPHLSHNYNSTLYKNIQGSDSIVISENNSGIPSHYNNFHNNNHLERSHSSLSESESSPSLVGGLQFSQYAQYAQYAEHMPSPSSSFNPKNSSSSELVSEIDQFINKVKKSSTKLPVKPLQKYLNSKDSVVVNVNNVVDNISNHELLSSSLISSLTTPRDIVVSGNNNNSNNNNDNDYVGVDSFVKERKQNKTREEKKRVQSQQEQQQQKLERPSSSSFLDSSNNKKLPPLPSYHHQQTAASKNVYNKYASEFPNNSEYDSVSGSETAYEPQPQPQSQPQPQTDSVEIHKNRVQSMLSNRKKEIMKEDNYDRNNEDSEIDLELSDGDAEDTDKQEEIKKLQREKEELLKELKNVEKELEMLHNG